MNTPHKQTGFTIEAILFVLILSSMVMIGVSDQLRMNQAQAASAQRWSETQKHLTNKRQQAIVQHLQQKCGQLPWSRGKQIQDYLNDEIKCSEREITAIIANAYVYSSKREELLAIKTLISPAGE